MGCVSAVGRTVDETRRNLFLPPREPELPKAFATSLENPVFEIALDLDRDQPGGRTAGLLFTALEEALANARLSASELAKRRVGVFVGTTVECQLNDLEHHAELRANRCTDGGKLAKYLQACSPAELVRRKYRLNGPFLTVSNACTSGADAIAAAVWHLNAGLCDLAIAGGADEINRVPYVGFNALGVCSKRHCRPFDRDREGLNLGEAAGVMILEKNAVANFFVGGVGKSADGFHITRPRDDGSCLKQAIVKALQMADVTPQMVDFVNAHGTGTQANDRVETLVYGELFPREVKFHSTKSMTGHTLGAAGAIEAIFTAIMLEEKTAVKSHGFANAEADAAVEPLRENSPIVGRWGLSTSLAFGGSNTAVLIGATGGAIP